MQHMEDEDEEDSDNNGTFINCKFYRIEDFKPSRFNSNKTLHLNIHSIEGLRVIVELLNFKSDFICLKESKWLSTSN